MQLKEVPEAAIRLTEDIVALSLAMKFLKSVMPENVSGESLHDNEIRLIAMTHSIRSMHRYASKKLAKGSPVRLSLAATAVCRFSKL